MHPVERFAIAVRRSPVLSRADAFWRLVRPAYRGLLGRFGRGGLVRTINGTDPIRVVPDLYELLETYEPRVWGAIMREIRPGDSVADIGANIGLYTVAMARRAGPGGRVYAAEPDDATLRLLARQVELNRVDSRVTILPAVVGDEEGTVAFTGGRQSESHVAAEATGPGARVRSVTLDTIFADARLDVLKIDVEGFEVHVLRGARRLLHDRARAPRTIFIEVHPAAWGQYGVAGDALLDLLASCHYRVRDLDGAIVREITGYGEIVARREAGS